MDYCLLLETEPIISKTELSHIQSTLLTGDGHISLAKLKYTNDNASRLIHSGRQIERRLIIFRRTCTPPILFWEYAYYEPSNFGRFHQIFCRILLPLT